MAKKEPEVLIIGAGVSGASNAEMIATYTNATEIAVREKDAGPGRENSDPVNNAQTPHRGPFETNYPLPKALTLRRAFTALMAYIKKRNTPGLHRTMQHMVLGVGDEEVAMLTRRYHEFKPHYPDIQLIGRDELAILEPKVMEGRDPSQSVIAIYSPDGHAVNYQQLAQCFIEDARAAKPGVDVRFNARVVKITRDSIDGKPTVTLDSGEQITPDVLIISAGAYSLFFAHMLGIAKEYGILPVAGDFYTTTNGPVLKGKVYRPQMDNIPFAAAHGDPDVLNDHLTRFGPTTLPLLMYERRHFNTVLPFMGQNVTIRRILALLTILWRRSLIGYVAKNVMYRVPAYGKWRFVQTLREIVPTLRNSGVIRRKEAGGIRPQVFRIDTSELLMGNHVVENGRVYIQTTPSPGASTCRANSYDVLNFIERATKGKIRVDRARLKAELGLE